METISLIDKVSERMGEDRSGDLGAGGVARTGSGTGDDTSTASARQQAINNLPEPKIMQKSLEKHIHKEVHQLNKQVKKLTKAAKPGNAYKINQMYARIRRLNGILSELMEASYDVLKRLYIRIFIDKQKIS